MSPPPTPAPVATPPATDPAHHFTAVVYFHGMGQQRRHEEASSLLAHLDQALQSPNSNLPRHGVYTESMRRPALDQSNIPPPDAGPKQIVYQQVANPEWPAPSAGASPDLVTPTVRFYEAYWAPHSVGGTSTPSVVRWLLRQWNRPIRVLGSPWRDLQEVRLSTLAGIYEDLFARAGYDDAAMRQQSALIQSLGDAYREFGTPEVAARPDCRRGDFREFRLFLQARTSQPAELDRMAVTWYRLHQRQQWANLAMIFLLLLGIGVLLGVAWWAFVTLFFKLFPGLWMVFENLLWPALRDMLKGPTRASTVARFVADIVAPILALLVLGGVAVLARPLRDFLGDVQQYVTYEETDTKYARHDAILNDTTAVLRHVLGEPNCKRVVVIAHSLGSVIAYDSLLQISRGLRLAPPGARPAGGLTDADLEKIRHFVTYGSPINKTIYFFATIRSPIPRYVQVIRQLRGDMSTRPFTHPNRDVPHVHWINFWDRGDIISGPLLSTVGRKIATERVDNVRVARHLRPNPGDSHTGYLKHHRLRKDVYDVIFANRYCFSPTEPDWVDVRGEPGYRDTTNGRQLPLMFLGGFLLMLALYAWLTYRIWQLALFILGLVALLALWGLVELLWRRRRNR